MTEEKIQLQAIDGEHKTELVVDELIITLPSGIAFSLFPGPNDEVVALITVPDEYRETTGATRGSSSCPALPTR